MDEAKELWRRQSDDQVIAAMLRLGDYTDEGQVIIREEMLRRGLILPHSEIHIYRVKGPGGGTMDVASVLPRGIAFTRGLVIESVVGRLRTSTDAGGTLTPGNFDANPVFAGVLHDVIARHAPAEQGLIDEARRRGSGRVYMIDGRSSAPDGAVPAEDVIGSFLVDGGVVVPGSYERNPNHAVLSAMGFFRMSPALHECLVAELAARELPKDPGD